MNEIELGLLAVMFAAAMLLLSVFRELAPAGGLTGRGRWLLAAGLGAGVLAFAAKLLIIGMMLASPLDLPRWLADAVHAGPRTLQPEPGVLLLPQRPYRWEALPLVAPAPPDNPTQPEKVALGQRLFEDRNLSLDRSLSCASCHGLQATAGSDGRRVSLGVGDQQGQRNAPTVWNAAFQPRLFWDGRAASLEEQATGPILNPVEMGMPSAEAVLARVKEDERYVAAFARVFGADEGVTMRSLAQALAAYERTLITPDTRYDRFVRGDMAALDAREIRGMRLFDEVGCVQCHGGAAFNGSTYPGTGAPWRAFPVWPDPRDADLRLTQDTGLAPAGSERGVWRVPTLRNIALTAPYFHNGSVDRLEDAVALMARVQLGLRITEEGAPGPQPYWMKDGQLQVLDAGRQSLSRDEIDALVAFLRALSDERLQAAAATAAAARTGQGGASLAR